MRLFFIAFFRAITIELMGKAQFRNTPDGKYAVGSILFKGMLVEFLFDAADLPRVRDHPWHYSSNAYIATSLRTETIDASGATVVKKREVYLHTFLMNPGPGQIVQHISKQGLDNRRENLRVLNAKDPAATVNSSAKKKRSIELPPMCGIRAEDIPKHIWYVQANGYHRDRFAIEFKTEGILWKSTSSKSVSLQEKLVQAKAKLAELYEAYPHLDPHKEEERITALTTTFEAALKAQEAQNPPLQ